MQVQTKIHYSHLAEQVTASSPLGQLLLRLEAFFVARGADAAAAHATAIHLLAQLVQEQGYVLAIQDAFRITLIFVAITVFVTLFIRVKRPARRFPVQPVEAPVDEAAPEEGTALATVEL